ncbi:hypothetical protein DCAR_0100572 [Daucus carota subsp. sativus]|nr:hypothetical protein DCAR_0100572 [Daucus carota subsp. sativus]
MPFWSAVSAHFFGVVLAGFLVNLLVNLGLKYDVLTGIALFIILTFMWIILYPAFHPVADKKLLVLFLNI